MNADSIEWADVIFVMEERHRSHLSRRFGKSIRGKKVVCLGIPDDYDYMDPELVRLLWERVSQSLPQLRTKTSTTASPKAPEESRSGPS